MPSRAALNRAASDATRARLLDAAGSVLSEMGQFDLRVAHVTERAGASRGTFYLHFKDREAILRAVAAEFLTGLDEALREAPERDSAYAQIETVMRCYVAYVLERKGVARATFELSDRDETVAAAFLELLRTWAARTVRSLRRLGARALSDDALSRRSFMLACMMEGVLKRAVDVQGLQMPGIDDPASIIQDFSTIWYQAIYGKTAPPAE